MRVWFTRCTAALIMAGLLMLAPSRQGATPLPGSQTPLDEEQQGIRLTNGKLQREEILKKNHEQNLKDAGRLLDLAEQLKIELERNEHTVLSISSLKKTDEIEKLAKRIRTRLRDN